MSQKNKIIYNNEEYAQYKDTIYSASKDGKIYSNYVKRNIKPLIRKARGKEYYYIDIYDKEEQKQKHVPVHRIVYIAWQGDTEEQVNHINDNSLDNRLENLYAGTQKENISDCIQNEHRVGQVFYLTLFDKRKQQTVTFCPAKDFILYSGHSCQNGCLSRVFSRKWFQSRYEIIEYKKINNLSELKSVTTKGDECNPVE